MKRFRAVLLGTLVCGLSYAVQSSEDASTAGEEQFKRDLAALTSRPHRLAGSPEGQAAGRYIESRLREIGVDELLPLDMQVWQTGVIRCELSASGTTVALHPMRGNGSVPPVTPPQGLTAPLRYVGRGELKEYGGRSVTGAIAVLEYDCHDNWRTAFALGARAVIFLGSDREISIEPKFVGLPANFLRLYASPQVQAAFDFRTDHDSVTVWSHVRWSRYPSRNVLAYLRGTQPQLNPDKSGPEMIVLSANYDSYGEVPTLSRGARGAANVAALLETVEYFKKNRPRRDMLFMFLDNQARYHEGARSVYDALMARPDLMTALAGEHRDELAFAQNLLAAIARIGKETIGLQLHKEIQALFKGDAEYHSTEINQRLMILRTRFKDSGEPESRREHLIDSLTHLYGKWNDAREAINKGTLDKIDPEQLSILRMLTHRRTRQRIEELEQSVNADRQAQELRAGIPDRWISLHVSYDFSDGGPSWGPMLGDDTDPGLRAVIFQSADNPGQYGRILRSVQEAAVALPADALLHRPALSDPAIVNQYVAFRAATSNHTAGTYGIYNMAFVTYHDARLREGHPSDLPEALQWRRIRRQALEANRLIYAVAATPSLYQQRVSSENWLTRVPRWKDGKGSGFYVGLSISGSIAESRPASGAVLMIAPGFLGDFQSSLGRRRAVPGFDRFLLENVCADGRFKVVSVRKDQFNSFEKNGLILVPVVFDSLGQVSAIVNSETMTTIEGLTMFPCKGYVFTDPLGGVPVQPSAKTQILQANGDALLRRDQSLTQDYDGFGFFYIHRNSSLDRIKLFRTDGVVFLGASPDDPYGNGFALDNFVHPPKVDRITALDLWQLNEARLNILRSRGVTNVDLELLQNRALQSLRKSEESTDAAVSLAGYGQSSTTSRLIYHPVKEVMNDLIKAVVILLLLAIPFAFALERLFICSMTIYGRVAGFAALFTGTFALMYWMHPGFRIASAPLIVFLSFAIILLTSMVIFIMVRKFRTEIMAYQGKSTGLHSADVSHGGTLIAAVNMGMSTMRRRPVRTALTCITVIMLTFTILCFASLTNSVGVKRFYEGGAGGDATGSFLIHMLDCNNLSPGLPGMLKGREGAGGFIAEHWWLVKRKKETYNAAVRDRPFSVAAITGRRDLFIHGIIGRPAEELRRWPRLASVFDGDSLEHTCELLDRGEVFLPRVLADQLRLKPGDSLLISGIPVRLAGTINVGNLQRLKNIDGKPILPVDFTDASFTGIAMATSTGALASSKVTETAQQDFIRLNANQVAIMSNDFVKKHGGSLHSVTIYSGSEIGAADEGRRLAELTGTPVWARGKEGVERLVFTRFTEVSGAYALIIPIILGGLIIFGTLLGSIADRQKEIYTFSALGLSPGHVGFLFLAEATVYAVIGGVGGQLLAQALALGASYLADLGHIQQPSINFSSTNSLFAIGMVMATVLVSAIYPAVRASKSANPGVQRSWRMPLPQGDVLEMKFPFTVSAYDITGVVSFLAEYFREHDDAGLGLFASDSVGISRNPTGNIVLSAHLTLAPFDLGITEDFSLTASPSEIEGIDEVLLTTRRRSGSVQDWTRANRTFIHDLRRQFLLWRTLSPDIIESYRMATLQVLGEEVETAKDGEPVTGPVPGLDLGLAT